MISSDASPYLTSAIFASLTPDEVPQVKGIASAHQTNDVVKSGSAEKIPSICKDTNESYLAPRTYAPIAEVPTRLPSLQGSSLSDASSTEASLRTASIWSALDIAPSPVAKDLSVVAVYNGVEGRSTSCAYGSSMLSLRLSDSAMDNSGTEEQRTAHGFDIVTPAAPYPIKASSSAAKTILNTLKDAASQANVASSTRACFVETSDWLGSKTDEVVCDYFSHKGNVTESRIGKTSLGVSAVRGIRNATKELIQIIAKDRAATSAKRDRITVPSGKVKVGISASVSCGVGFNVDGSGPGFRWLVPPVEAASPVRQRVLASSVSTQVCNVRHSVPGEDTCLSTVSAFDSDSDNDSDSERRFSSLSIELPWRSSQDGHPTLRPMDSTLGWLETPSPMEALPSPVVLSNMDGCL